jgi:hypothetical protein
MKTTSNAYRRRREPGLWCRSVWESFQSDDALRREHQITDAEMKALERVSMLGQVMSKEDYLFILGVVRGKRT